MTLGREGELVAQLRDLLFLPSPSTTRNGIGGDGAWPPSELVPAQLVGSVDKCSVKVESGGRPDDTSRSSTMAEEACGGSGTRRRRGSKRARAKAKDEQHDEPGGPSAQPRCSKIRKKQQTTVWSIVTSVPDFDGYQWRKYGQKQIEGAMYPRCIYAGVTTGALGALSKAAPPNEQVQRNDDDGGDNGAPKYTVYMAEHSCTANDSLEAPVILETTAAVVPTTKRPHQDDDTNSIAIAAFQLPAARHDAVDDDAPAAGSCPTTTTTESPATLDNTWGSTGAEHVDDSCGLFPVIDDSSWVPTTPASSLLQEMEDFTGPIRSPVHITAGCWTIDHYLHLLNEPITHFSAGFSLYLVKEEYQYTAMIGGVIY